MSNNKIEILAERRSARKNSDKTLRVLRHLDAARAKLDALQIIRRQLKAELRQADDEKQQALSHAEDLELKNRQYENELEALQILLEEQAELLSRYGLDRQHQWTDSDDQDGPALTLLAVEKATTTTALAKTPAPADDSATSTSTNLLSRIRWPWNSDHSKTTD